MLHPRWQRAEKVVAAEACRLEPPTARQVRQRLGDAVAIEAQHLEKGEGGEVRGGGGQAQVGEFQPRDVPVGRPADAVQIRELLLLSPVETPLLFRHGARPRPLVERRPFTFAVEPGPLVGVADGQERRDLARRRRLPRRVSNGIRIRLPAARATHGCRVSARRVKVQQPRGQGATTASRRGQLCACAPRIRALRPVRLRCSRPGRVCAPPCQAAHAEAPHRAVRTLAQRSPPSKDPLGVCKLVVALSVGGHNSMGRQHHRFIFTQAKW